MFEDLLAEIKGFKYQITLDVLLSKYNGNAERELFAPVYFNSTTKSEICLAGSLDKSFKKFLIGWLIGLVKDLVR